MKQVLIIACNLIALFAASEACNLKKFNVGDYLFFPPEDVYTDLEFNEHIPRAIARLDPPVGIGFKAISRMIKEEMNKHPVGTVDHEIYKELFSISVPKLDCTRKLVDLVLSIWPQTRNERLSLGPGSARLVDYLDYYGQFKFRLCGRNASIAFEEPEEGAVWDALDEAFRAAFKLGKKSTLVDLHHKLRKLDLTRSTFKAKRMFGVMKKYMAKGVHHHRDESMLVKHFMLDRCEQFGESLRNELNIIALAHFFEAKYKYKKRLLILNEYQRLCLQFTRSPVEVNRNLKKQLEPNPLRCLFRLDG